jgi:hypothetical protein
MDHFKGGRSLIDRAYGRRLSGRSRPFCCAPRDRHLPQPGERNAISVRDFGSDTTQRKIPRGRDDEERLTADIAELARQYGRYGYRKIAELLRRAGWLGRVLINSVHVRFAPKATEILRCREMTRCASCGLMQRSKKSIIRLSCRRAIRAPCGNFKADRPRGLEIDDQLEVRRLLDRYIGTLGSAQNFSRQSCPLSQELGEPRTIANLCITANLAANVAVGS